MLCHVSYVWVQVEAPQYAISGVLVVHDDYQCGGVIETGAIANGMVLSGCRLLRGC